MGVNDDRNVTVRLGLSVRDYLAGGAAADAMNRRLLASQRALGNESDITGGKLTKLAKDTEKSAGGAGTALKFMGIGLAGLGAAGGGLKVIPPLLAAVGTGAAALPGMLGGAINSALVLKLGLTGISDQLGKIYKAKDPFLRLTPNARNFLAEAERIKPTLLGFQSGLQNRLMRGTGADLTLLATKTLPAVRGQLNALADDWAATFAEIALSMSDSEITDSWNTVLGGADRFFDEVNARIRPTAHSIAELITESQPVADQVGKALVGMLDRFNAKVAEAKRNGSLAQFFEAGAAAAREMADIAGNVLDITGMIISETAKQSAAIGNAGDKLDAYMASGRAAADIAGIVHTLTTAYEGLASTVGPLAGVLRDALADPGTAQSIQQMFTILSAGSQVISTVLQVFLSLNNVLGGLPLTAIAFALAIGKMSALMDLASAAAVKGAAKMEAYGGAIGKAGGKLPALVDGLGKAAIAWVALDAAHSIIDQWQGDAIDVQGMTDSVAAYAKGGAAAGEMTRDFGKNLDDLGNQLVITKSVQDNAFGGFIASAEKAVPIAGDIAQALGAWSLTGSAENVTALDKSLTDYVSKTGDVKGAQDALNRIMKESGMGWADLRDLLPQTNAAIGAAGIATMQLEAGTKGLAERQALLNAPLRETVTLGRSLLEIYNQLNGANVGFAQATIAAEQAVDQLHDGLKANGLALNESKHGFDTNTEKGRQNLTLTLALAEAAGKAAQAKLDDNGTVEQAATVYDKYINRLRATLAAQGASPAMINHIVSEYAQMPAALQNASAAANSLNNSLNKIPKGTRFTFDGSSLVNGKGQTLELRDGIKGLPPGKTFTWNGKSLVDGKGKAYALTEAVNSIPTSKRPTIVTSSIDGAKTKVNTLAQAIRGMPDGNAHVSVDTGGALASLRQLRANITALGGTYIGAAKNRRGGVYTRAARSGLVEAQVAPPGTLYQWAEPETGGEAFIPKKGDQRRGRAIVDQAAEWYGMRAVPMHAGGITTAAAGLVNVAPSTSSSSGPTATPLDFAQAYLQARDAVKSLSTALKDNGRSFSISTVKGRENRSALYSAISAAQDAAKTKFNETGSVRLANAAYATYIARLRGTLQQQKVNSATIRSLISLASRPVYDVNTTRAPANSLTNIAYAKAAIGAAAGVEDLRDKLSLNQVGVGLGTEGGRDNLSNILGFFETAASAAQARYEQTKSSKSATALYNSYVAQLQSILKAAGYPAATIAGLVKSYGRITLTGNARGGVYMAAAGGLSGPSITQPGDRPMYGWAEPGTGGELFVPRNGNQRRGRDLLDVASGWYGGRFVAGGQGDGGGSTTINNNLNVTPLSYNPTTAELLGHLRLMDAQARTGRRR